MQLVPLPGIFSSRGPITKLSWFGFILFPRPKRSFRHDTISGSDLDRNSLKQSSLAKELKGTCPPAPLSRALRTVKGDLYSFLYGDLSFSSDCEESLFVKWSEHLPCHCLPFVNGCFRFVKWSNNISLPLLTFYERLFPGSVLLVMLATWSQSKKMVRKLMF